MSYRLCIFCWLLATDAMGQFKSSDSSVYRNVDTIPGIIKQDFSRLEILTGGSIDFIQTGQVNASARFFKLYVGEPGRFRVPVSVFTGVSANHFSNSLVIDEDIALALLNPGAGVLNIHVDGAGKITGRNKITSLQANYQMGFRWLNLYNTTSLKNTTFFNLITGAGLTFITGAWEASDENSPGIFWLNARGLYAYSPPSVLRTFFPVPIAHHLFGCSGGMGIELSQVLDIKLFYFHFLNNRQVDAFRPSFVQLSFNYSSW